MVRLSRRAAAAIEQRSNPEIDYICDIGLASSADGVHFVRDVEHNPFFRRGADVRFSFEDVNLVTRNGRYYLFCNRWDWEHSTDPQVSGVFLAISDDLLTWRSMGLVFPRAQRIHRNPCVVQDPHNEAVWVDGRYVMYLNEGLIAYSSDLIHWESTEVKSRWPGSEGCFALAHYLHPDDDRVLLFTGGHHSGHFYTVGEVLFSEEAPDTPKTWLNHPVLVADAFYPWENGEIEGSPHSLMSYFRDTIFFTGMTQHQGRWWLYYGGSEYYTCLAHAEVNVRESSSLGGQSDAERS